MGQSFVINYVHIVFSTKNREPFIFSPFSTELYQYLGGICNRLECKPIMIGGHVDHVHILCLLSKKIALMDLLEKVKANSSKWMKTKDVSLLNFYWQDGYGAFSVSPSQVQKVKVYIENQEQHHRNKNFQQEYLSILGKYNMEYDERYIWS